MAKLLLTQNIRVMYCFCHPEELSEEVAASVPTSKKGKMRQMAIKQLIPACVGS